MGQVVLAGECKHESIELLVGKLLAWSVWLNFLLSPTDTRVLARAILPCDGPSACGIVYVTIEPFSQMFS
jgi:hypothetical protein